MNLFKLSLPLAMVALGSGCGLVDLFDGDNSGNYTYYDDFYYDSGVGGDFGGGGAAEYESSRWNYRTTTWASINSLAIRNNRTAWAGMYSLTCEVSLENGGTMSDLDLDWTEEERVIGVDGGTVIATTGDSIVTIDPETVAQDETPTGNLIDAVPSGGTVTTIERDDGDCWVRVYGIARARGGRERLYNLSVDASLCLGGKVTTDGEGRVWVGSGAGVTEVVPTAPTQSTSSVISSIGADILVFDPDAQLLYAAARFDDNVYGLESDGSVRWQATMPAPIRDLKLVPGELAALVAVGSNNGGGQIIRLSAEDGTWTSEMSTARAPTGLAVGPDGAQLAVRTATDVSFFSLR